MVGQRPGGVVLIAILAWIGAVLQIVSGILVLTGVLNPEGISNETAWIAIVVGVASFVVAFALFGGSNIARILVAISFVFSFISAIVQFIAHPANFIATILAAIVALIGLVLLYTSKSNAYFSR
ncbi:hypothetical protein [Agreia sp. VKM Ac-1783]|uniref:hypothetical protein n=1 Tax=Agreia sp. VKM Ac-1783 TaxID=1938889 RepID=UPI000A2AD58B|nr:hypothetical protein [Agreia sp. VKM Ac-1783]SMQ68393.1 hypothetical protein SAMN06295943_1814 [Agreia sp. VKM Ac-1783]